MVISKINNFGSVQSFEKEKIITGLSIELNKQKENNLRSLLETKTLTFSIVEKIENEKDNTKGFIKLLSVRGSDLFLFATDKGYFFPLGFIFPIDEVGYKLTCEGLDTDGINVFFLQEFNGLGSPVCSFDYSLSCSTSQSSKSLFSGASVVFLTDNQGLETSNFSFKENGRSVYVDNDLLKDKKYLLYKDIDGISAVFELENKDYSKDIKYLVSGRGYSTLTHKMTLEMYEYFENDLVNGMASDYAQMAFKAMYSIVPAIDSLKELRKVYSNTLLLANKSGFYGLEGTGLNLITD